MLVRKVAVLMTVLVVALFATAARAATTPKAAGCLSQSECASEAQGLLSRCSGNVDASLGPDFARILRGCLANAAAAAADAAGGLSCATSADVSREVASRFGSCGRVASAHSSASASAQSSGRRVVVDAAAEVKAASRLVTLPKVSVRQSGCRTCGYCCGVFSNRADAFMCQSNCGSFCNCL
jgi:hypothetical protein